MRPSTAFRVLGFATAIVLALPPRAAAGVDIEARRLGFDRADAVYAPTESGEIVLTYRPAGDPSTARDVRVAVEIRTNPATRLAFRMREVTFPQGDREFRMPVDFLRLGIAEGTYGVTATVDADDMVRETDETNNQARSTLTISRRSTTPPPSTTAPGAFQELQPRGQRVVARTTCSAFEREWTSPLEAGWHPGYGHASLVLEFPHPASAARPGDRVLGASLVLRGSAVGRPFAELGTMQVLLRTKGGAGPGCGAPIESRASVTDVDGRAEVDLMAVVRDAARLAPGCATALQVVLQFPEPVGDPHDAAFIRLDPRGAAIEVETGR